MNKELEEAKEYLKKFNDLILSWSLKEKCELNKAIETVLNYIENSISKEEYDKIKEENETLKLKERSRIIGKYKEVEVHDVINQVLSKDYISKEIIKEKIKEVDDEFNRKNISDNSEWYIDSNICEYAKEKLLELLGDDKNV